jgi:hypothetical protein
LNPFLNIAYRMVALAFGLSCGRTALRGIVERQIPVVNTDVLDWWSPTKQLFYKDASPVGY